MHKKFIEEADHLLGPPRQHLDRHRPAEFLADRAEKNGVFGELLDTDPFERVLDDPPQFLLLVFLETEKTVQAPDDQPIELIVEEAGRGTATREQAQQHSHQTEPVHQR